MKKRFKLILTALVIVLLAIAVVWYLNFFLPTQKTDMHKQTAIPVSSEMLVDDFKNNETTATAKFADKIVDVTGVVLDVKTDSLTSITLSSSDIMTNVYCTLNNSITNIPSNGTIITIRGVCVGVLNDVLIKNAIIIEPKK